MSQEENRAIPPDIIQKLGKSLDKKSPPIVEGPGVYYMAIREYGEYYIIEQTSPIISDKAKTYGKQHPDYGDLLFYSLNDECSGSKIIDYELEKYASAQDVPEHDPSTLHIAAVYGAEYHPEYFGAYPAPIRTPWGCMLRYRCIENGIFWLETDQRMEALTICYPIWSACLSQETVRLGVTIERVPEDGRNAALGHIFFNKTDACIPIFELMRTYQEWGKDGRIAAPALMNAIWQNHPGYVLIHNIQEQFGLNDMLYNLLKQFDIQTEPNISVDNMIAMFPNEGVEYIHF